MSYIIELARWSTRIEEAAAIHRRLSSALAIPWEPAVRHLMDGDIELQEPMTVFWTDALLGLQRLKVPFLFHCDGASRPRVTWSLTGRHPYEGSSLAAAIMHDFAFCERPPLTGGTRMTIEYAAALYRLMLETRSGEEWPIEFRVVLGPTALRLWRSHD